MDVTTTKIVVLVIVGLVILITLLGEIRFGKRSRSKSRYDGGGARVDTDRPEQPVGAGSRR